MGVAVAKRAVQRNEGEELLQIPIDVLGVRELPEPFQD
jgi:hypothetical protein